VDLVGNGSDQGFEEVRSCLAVSGVIEPGEGELGGAVHGHEQVQLAFFGADLGDVEVEVADGIGLELLLWRLGSFDIGQAGDISWRWNRR
jgi:hypothetical protein